LARKLVTVSTLFDGLGVEGFRCFPERRYSIMPEKIPNSATKQSHIVEESAWRNPTCHNTANRRITPPM